ncbi:hypothetical protein K474DRAFT_1673362 [Panus rudis PR-1116 ss-1]|nr:hypothetical protein K474DRAFT_1673362 [Panus rudis PR-1116 ss-1]
MPSDSDAAGPSATGPSQGRRRSKRRSKTKASSSKSKGSPVSGGETKGKQRDNDVTGLGTAAFGLGGSATANVPAVALSTDSRVDDILRQLSAGVETSRTLRSTSLNVSKSTVSHEEAAAEAEQGRSRMASSTKARGASTASKSRVVSEPVAKSSSKRPKANAPASTELKATAAVVLRPCGVGYDETIVDGSPYFLHDSILPAYGTLTQLCTDSLAARKFEFSRQWGTHELEHAFWMALPHVFAYFDGLPPRADGKHHWVLCGKTRSSGYIAAHQPTGQSVYEALVKTSGVWSERVVYIASQEEIPPEVLREWRSLSDAQPSVVAAGSSAACSTASVTGQEPTGRATENFSTLFAGELSDTVSDDSLPSPSTILVGLPTKLDPKVEPEKLPITPTQSRRLLMRAKPKSSMKRARSDPANNRNNICSRPNSDVDSASNSYESGGNVSEGMKSPPHKVHKSHHNSEPRSGSYAGDTDADSSSGSDSEDSGSDSDAQMANIRATIRYVSESIQEAKRRAASNSASGHGGGAGSSKVHTATNGSDQLSKLRPRAKPQPHPMTVDGPVDKGFVDLTLDDDSNNIAIDGAARHSPAPFQSASRSHDAGPNLDNPRRKDRAAVRDRYNFDF